MYQLEAKKHGNALTVQIGGELLMPDMVDFMARMEGLCATEGVAQIVLDTGNLARMDPAGLGVIVSLSTRTQSRGRRIVLLRPGPLLQKLLQNAEIEGFFPTCESEEELRGYIPEASGVRKAAQ